MRAVALAAVVAWAGLLARSPDAAPAAPDDEGLENVATRTRVALETLVAEAQQKVRACEDGCTKDESQKLAAQLHRYQTALEQLSEYANDNSTVLRELAASRIVEAKQKDNVANLRAVLSGSHYAEDTLEKQEEFLTEQIAQVKADEKTTIRALGQAERKLLAAQSDVQSKKDAAEVWATEILSIKRAAQLGDQYAEAMYASGVEKHAEAKEKEKRAKDLLKRADKLADRIDERLSPPSIVEEEHEDKPSSSGWGTWELPNSTSLSNVSREDRAAQPAEHPAEHRANHSAEHRANHSAEHRAEQTNSAAAAPAEKRVAPRALLRRPLPALDATDSADAPEEASSPSVLDDDDSGPDRLFEAQTEDEEMNDIESELRETGADDTLY
jgi:hypothetical protein